ncbi:cation transporter [Pseudomonas sp. CFBP 8758]|uniref:DUF6482 family protein n=1 Tax=Pseudomonas sp. CFBP 8758 TaxID=2775286 RepID=UPI00177BE772|nr:DUF6482 family protein [Pseudomonas sp. CFBP 8758]MBD8595560.1 cation transporter [Pseudomonas sp. CFBP 8758]
MNIDKLSSHVNNGEVSEVNLVSMEGGSYVLHAILEGVSQPVADAKGATLHVASVEEARKVLSGVADIKLFLVQGNAHDEMIGNPEGGHQVMREEIPLRSSL